MTLLWIPIGVVACVIYFLLLVHLPCRRDRPMMKRIMENDKKMIAMSWKDGESK